jgi:hypothetical protein
MALVAQPTFTWTTTAGTISAGMLTAPSVPVTNGTVTASCGAVSGTATFAVASAGPIVTGISVAKGPVAGGTAVTITGTNLSNATAVMFGSTAGTISSSTATQIVVSSPAGTAGTVDVRVVTAGGTSATSSADRFTYQKPPAPTVTGISLTKGSTAGGTTVTITGTNLTNATSVMFGSKAGTIVSNTATQIVVTTPAGTVGTVDVRVVTAGGTSATSSVDKFAYLAGPTISSVVVASSAATPAITWNVADSAGIQSATITVDGANLAVSAPSGTSVNANYTGVLGALAAGSHTYVITATDANGVSTTLTGTFTLLTPLAVAVVPAANSNTNSNAVDAVFATY